MNMRNPLARGTQATHSPSAVEIAWAAGFLEGEGTFRFQKVNPTTGTKRSGTLFCGAGQLQMEPLQRLSGLFGGAVWRSTFVPKHRPDGKPIAQWSISGPRAAGVMLTLYSFMSPRRREQIADALARWREAPGFGGQNREKTHCPQGHEYAVHTMRTRAGRLCAVCQKEHKARYRREGRPHAR